MSNKYFKNPYKTSSRRQITARILKEEAANAPAGFLGVTTKNVKYEMEYLVSFFNEKEGRAND